MKISVIIPTYNADIYIHKLLMALSSQDLAPAEIIIIDSSSEDNTVDIAKGFGAKTIVIPKQSFNHGKTRNIAALKAQGDILVFMTQDALPFDNTLLRKLTEPLKENDIAASFARQIPKADASPLEVFSKHFNYPDKKSVKGKDDAKKYGIMTFRLSNVCSAIKLEPFLKVGMFPEDIKSNEDMLITAKLIKNGYKAAYVPEAIVIHSHNDSLLKLFIRYYNIGSSLRKNKWILQFAPAEVEGIRFFKEQLIFISKQHKYIYIPYIILQSITKYAGYRIGLIAG